MKALALVFPDKGQLLGVLANHGIDTILLVKEKGGQLRNDVLSKQFLSFFHIEFQYFVLRREQWEKGLV